MLCNPGTRGCPKIVYFIVLMYTIITPVFLDLAFAVYQPKSGDIQITDFEYHPNSLDGNVGAYGAITGSEYTSERAYSGQKSYKLVFAKDVIWKPEHEVEYETTRHGTKKIKKVGASPKLQKIDWAVFMLDMGPVLDANTHPVKIQPIDISRFRYLVFWVKGERGGEKFKIYFRDVHANTYDPQLILEPNIVVTKKWEAVAVDLKRISRKIDIKNIVQIGLGFGKKDGNKLGNIMYVDNFILVK